MKRALVFAIVLCVVTLTGSRPEAQQGTIIQRVLVKVNGEPFTQKDLEEKQIEVLQQGGQGDLQGEALTKTLTDMMPELLVKSIDDMLQLQRGKEANYHMTEEQFKGFLDGVMKNNNIASEDELKAGLAQDGLTMEGFRKRIEKQFIINEVQRTDVLSRIPLTEQELKQYFEQHPDEFLKSPTVTLRELLVAVPIQEGRAGQAPTFSPSLDQAAREKIQAIRERAPSTDFEKLITEASDSPSKSAGGLIGPINVSELAANLRDVLEKLQVGEVTQPIRTPRGYQLFKLETRTVAEGRPFEEVKEDIAQKIGEARLDIEVEKYLKQLRTQAFLDWKRDDLRQMYEKRLAQAAAAPVPAPAVPPPAK